MVDLLRPSAPVVDKEGKPLRILQLFSEDVRRMATIIGIGSPEGVVEAVVGQEYLDTNGLPGAIKFVKQKPDIAGDRKQGWTPI